MVPTRIPDFLVYCERSTDRPSIPIRTIVGLLLLKLTCLAGRQVYNLGDETVVERYLLRVFGRIVAQERSNIYQNGAISSGIRFRTSF